MAPVRPNIQTFPRDVRKKNVQEDLSLTWFDYRICNLQFLEKTEPKCDLDPDDDKVPDGCQEDDTGEDP